MTINTSRSQRVIAIKAEFDNGFTALSAGSIPSGNLVSSTAFFVLVPDFYPKDHTEGFPDPSRAPAESTRAFRVVIAV